MTDVAEKYLHVIGTLNPEFGGPVRALHGLVSSVTKFGVEVSVISLDAPGSGFASSMAVPVVELGPGRGKMGVVSYQFTPRLVPWLKANAGKYRAVIVHGIWQYQSFGTWRALRKSQVPYFVFTHGALDPWYRKTYPRKHVKKWMYWPWADYRVLRDARAVLFTSEEERLKARESFWLYRVRERVIRYGTYAPPEDADGQLRAFLGRFPELHGKRIVLFMGRLHAVKGCDLLVEAFARVASSDPRAHLVFAGPDQDGLWPRLESMARAAGIADRVSWLGMIGPELKWGALRAADVLAAPSHNESFGMAVVEALSCAVPGVISDKVNIWREIQADGAAIVDEDSVEGTRRSLEEWLRLPEVERSAMRRNALRCFKGRFDIAENAAHFLSVLREESGARAVAQSAMPA